MGSDGRFLDAEGCSECNEVSIDFDTPGAPSGSESFSWVQDVRMLDSAVGILEAPNLVGYGLLGYLHS